MNPILELAEDAMQTVHGLFGASPTGTHPLSTAKAGFSFTGRCSTFGGPADRGVGPHEDLALWEAEDIRFGPAGLFLGYQPKETSGTARRLNPKAYYLAVRFATTRHEAATFKPGLGVCLPVVTPRQYLRSTQVLVSAHGKVMLAWIVDWGPNSTTGRMTDLSPGLAEALGLTTDDMVTVTLPGIFA